MPQEEQKPWEQQLREAAARAEEEVRRVVTYINDEVMPEIRVNGSHALRAAAEELQKLAQRMDDRRAAASGQAPPPQDEGKPKP
jgi:trans-2-enoyl-CoA reductase